MIKELLQKHLEEFKANKTTELAQELAENKRTIVTPEFARLEQLKTNAIAELKAKFDEDVKSMNDKTNAQKEVFENTQRALVTAEVESKYEKVINTIQNQIDSIKE